jgi:hypothetical protein
MPDARCKFDTISVVAAANAQAGRITARTSSSPRSHPEPGEVLPGRPMARRKKFVAAMTARFRVGIFARVDAALSP